MIVQYFERDGAKTFDVQQALRCSGWGVELEKLLETTGLVLTDRLKPSHVVTVSHITYSRWFEMYFVHYAEGGWQCLDHAIEQFRLKRISPYRREWEEADTGMPCPAIESTL
jgi:hypothetical protein